MSFFQGKFCGLSVKDFKTSLGFNQQSSQLNVQLVQDTLFGDIADFPLIGSPVYFSFGAFTFAGLLQSHKQSNSPNGLPVFDVVIIDPREILEGAQVITSTYTGGVPAGMSNVFNVYGYWETNGFGKSQSTQAGMPWALVLQAILSMANTPVVGAYGGPLQYKGVAYSLDLSEIPIPPGYYRLPTGYLSLLETIHLICEDCGCDYYVILVGTTIKVKIVSRFFQPPLGTITALALSSTYSGSTIEADAGLEARNEVNSVLLIGGEKTGVFITQNIYSYWGTDINGTPIVGTPGTLAGFGATEFANLNAADCADIVGSTTYNCSVIEMRFALWDVSAWAAFINKNRPDISNFIGAGIYGDRGNAAPIFAPDIVNDDPVARAVNQITDDNRARLFDLVHRYAEDFYGKQFLVTIDGVQASIDNETGQITTSSEPTNAGYMPFGASSLGVPANRLDVLQEADERVLSFAYYSSIIGADLSRINWSETAVDNTGQMWVRTQTDNRILFAGNPIIPYVHVKLGGALYEPKLDNFGNAGLAGQVIAVNGPALQNLDANAFGGSIGYLGIYPAARYPTALGIPMKSNTDTYGPWFVAGAAGKVRIEQDSSLTPWDYGSSAVMDLAGQARVLTSVTNQQVSESGGLNIAGAPAYSLGDVMTVGGPNLTNLEISFGTQGVSTNYRWQTFTPKFGLFSRQNSERLRRVSLGLVQQRRDMRRALNRAIVAAGIVDKATKGAKFNKAFFEKRQSPSTVIMAQANTSGSDTRVACGFENYESALSMLNQGTNFPDKAIMSISGLVRGFSTNPSSTSKLSKYTSIGSFAGTNAPITNNTLNPFVAGNDIEIQTWGQAYAGSNAYVRGNDPTDTRAIALRGPIIISGIGLGIDGLAYPDGTTTSYSSNALRRSDLWKTGTVDLLWDNKRGCWTSHDILTGVTSGATTAGSNGTVKIGNDSGWTMSVYNQWSSTIATAKKCLIGYAVNENRWHFIAVDC